MSSQRKWYRYSTVDNEITIPRSLESLFHRGILIFKLSKHIHGIDRCWKASIRNRLQYNFFELLQGKPHVQRSFYMHAQLRLPTSQRSQESNRRDFSLAQAQARTRINVSKGKFHNIASQVAKFLNYLLTCLPIYLCQFSEATFVPCRIRCCHCFSPFDDPLCE